MVGVTGYSRSVHAFSAMPYCFHLSNDYQLHLSLPKTPPSTYHDLITKLSTKNTVSQSPCPQEVPSTIPFFFKKNYLFIYLLLAVLGLCFCAWAFSSCGERGPLFIVVRGPLTVAVSLVAEHKLQTRRLSSCGSQA